VRVIEVPQTLIEIHPEWRGHRFFVVRDEIVIVDRELAIVAVVPVGGSSTEIDRSGPRGGMAAGEGSSGPSVSLSVEEIRQLQIVLKEKGFFRGEPDGVFGPQTRQALIVFQRQQGFQASGRIDSQTVTALGLSTRQQGGAQPSTSGQGTGAGAQGQSGSQPSMSGQGGDRTQQSPGAAGAGTGAQGDQRGSQPSTSGQANPPAGRGQGSDKMQQSPGGDQGAGGGAQGSQSGSQPSTSGQGNPPAASGQGGERKR
jgi:peptidoglycan hydrolase-like protein with peptidoglycan-binding domain